MSGLPLRPDLVGVAPYGAPVLDVPVRLNVNENPYPPPAPVVEEMGRLIARALTTANRYPDREAKDLRRAAADHLGLSPDSVWAANGSNEVMHQAFAAFGGPGRTALSFAPSYSMYPQYARETFTRYQVEARASDFTITPELVLAAVDRIRPSIVVIAAPNNPTGTDLEIGVLAEILEATREAGLVVIVDEAYAEFRDCGLPSAASLLADHEHLAVTRTLSKAFGLAGLRVGYLAGGPAVVDALRIVRLPYHLSTATQVAATVALRNSDALLAPVEGVRRERARMASELTGLGLDVSPSQANFLFVGGFDDRRGVWDALVAHGVLVRETGPAGWLRFSIGTPAENDAALTALAEVLSTTVTTTPAETP